MEIKQCWQCKGQAWPRHVEENRNFGVMVSATMKVWHCYDCEEWVVSGEELGRAFRVWALKVAESGVHSCGAFRLIRKTLGYTALYRRKELEELAGAPIETIKRWESGFEKLPHDVMAKFRKEILQHDLSSLTKLQEEQIKLWRT